VGCVVGGGGDEDNVKKNGTGANDVLLNHEGGCGGDNRDRRG